MAWGYLIWSLPYVLLTWYVLFHCGGRAQHGHSPTLHCIALARATSEGLHHFPWTYLKLYVIRFCRHKQIVCLVHITGSSNHHPTVIQRSRAAPKVPLWHPPTPPHKRTTSQWADLAASWRALGLPKRGIEPAMDTHVHLLDMNRTEEVSKRPTKSQAFLYTFSGLSSIKG